MKLNCILKIKSIFRKNYLHGSSSIEAALIVPVIFGMLFAMLYVLFFLHDKDVLYGNMNREMVLVCEGEREYSSEKKWQETIQSNLWILRVNEGKLSSGRLQVDGNAAAEGKWEIPVMGMFVNKKFTLKLEIKRSNVVPGEMLWGKRIIKSEENAD